MLEACSEASKASVGYGVHEYTSIDILDINTIMSYLYEVGDLPEEMYNKLVELWAALP